MNVQSKIGIGTVQFGMPYGISNTDGQTPPEEVANILHMARKNGIGVIDTAFAYGNAEQILGTHDLEGFRIVSKFMPPENGERIEEQCKRSLRHLNVPALYGYLAHRPSALLAEPESWDELQGLKKEGWIQKIGFSLNTPEELTSLLEAGFSPDLVQVPFNYFDRRFAGHMIPLKNAGCEIHARSVFLQGLFFITPGHLSGFFDEVKPLIRFLQQEMEHLPGALLRFVVEQPFVDNVIAGVNNSRQLIENIESLQSAKPLPELKHTISEKILMPSVWPG